MSMYNSVWQNQKVFDIGILLGVIKLLDFWGDIKVFTIQI